MLLPAVELRRLTKLYREGDGERVVLRDASATIGLGEIGVLIGRSGSGKSTVLNLISGIDRPTERARCASTAPTSPRSTRARARASGASTSASSSSSST